jgi:hypothetical protein
MDFENPSTGGNVSGTSDWHESLEKNKHDCYHSNSWHSSRGSFSFMWGLFSFGSTISINLPIVCCIVSKRRRPSNCWGYVASNERWLWETKDLERGRAAETHSKVSTKHWPRIDETEKNKKFWDELIAYFPWYDTDRIENDVSNNSSIVACVFVAAATFLPSRCLATTGGFLPNTAVT